MTPDPLYQEDRPCAKCGHLRCGTLWQPGLNKLRRTCGRCGYEWNELPLDREEERDVSPV